MGSEDEAKTQAEEQKKEEVAEVEKKEEKEETKDAEGEKNTEDVVEKKEEPEMKDLYAEMAKDDKVEEEENEELVIEVGTLLEGRYADKKKGDRWFEVKVLEIKEAEGKDTLYKVQWTYDDKKNESELALSDLRKVGGSEKKKQKREEKAEEEEKEEKLVIEVGTLLEGRFADKKKGDRWFEVKVLEIKEAEGKDTLYRVQWTYDDDKNESELPLADVRKIGGGQKKQAAPQEVEKVDKLSMSLDDLISDTQKSGKGKGKNSDRSGGGGGSSRGGSGGGSSWGGSGGGGGGKSWSSSGGGGGSSWEAKKDWGNDKKDDWGAKKDDWGGAKKSWDSGSGGGDSWSKKPAWEDKKPAWDAGGKSSSYDKSSYGDKSYGGGGGGSSYAKSSYGDKSYGGSGGGGGSSKSYGDDKYASSKSYDKYGGDDKYAPKSSDRGGGSDRRRDDDDRDRRRDSAGGGSSRDYGSRSSWAASGGSREAPAAAPVEGATVIVSGIQGLRVDKRDLEKAFAAVGTVESCDMKSTHAVISFSSKRAAHEAVRRFHGGQLNDRTIDVKLAGGSGGGGGGGRDPPPRDRSPRRGGGGGGGSGGGGARSGGGYADEGRGSTRPTGSSHAASARQPERRRERSRTPVAPSRGAPRGASPRASTRTRR